MAGESDQFEYYWASEEDPEKMVANLIERRDSFWEVIRESSAFASVLRSWRMYHNLYFPEALDSTTFAIKHLGEENEVAALTANHYRNLIQHALNLSTQHRVSWQTKAVNSDQKSLDQSRIGNQLLEYYKQQKRIERNFKTAAEHALVLKVGYIFAPWNPNIGEAQGLNPGSYDPESGDMIEPIIDYEGDLHIENLTCLDVVYDPVSRSQEEWQWTLIRTFENRWDMIARYPELKEDLLLVDAYSKANEPFLAISLGGYERSKTDRIPVWHFFHKPTDALPQGRHFAFAGAKSVFMDTQAADLPFPYDGLPIFRMAAGELLLTCFGYSPAEDIQGIAEAINAEISTTLTNHKNFGFNKVWTRTGDTLNREVIDDTTTNYQSDQKPEPLNLLSENPGILNFANFLIQQAEYLIGINSVARGQPEASLKSGTALAVIHAQAVQFATTFIQNYIMLQEDLGTHILRTLKRYANTKRVVSILGEHNRAELVSFSSEDLQKIDRVMAQPGNALTNTMAGKMQIAEMAVQQGLIRDVSQIITLIETGNIEPLFESERSNLTRIRLENEAMMKGTEIPPPLATDYHVLDIREHAAKLSDPEIRLDQKRVSTILGHVMTHIQLMMDPGVQLLQMALGYPNPLAMAQAAPGGIPGRKPQDLGGRPQDGAPGGLPGPAEPTKPSQVPVQQARPPQVPGMPEAKGGMPAASTTAA